MCIWRVYPVGTRQVSGGGKKKGKKWAPDLGLLLLGFFSQNIFVLFSKEFPNFEYVSNYF
jgi:hypothetical protein